MALGRKLRTWRRLTRHDRRAVLRAVPVLTVAGLAIRVLGFARTRRLASPGVAGRTRADEAERLAGGVARAARALPWHPQCLERSLALTFLLRRRGLDARLRIGVRKQRSAEAPRLAMPEAHAWVEVDGRVIGDRVDVRDRFAAFDDDGPASQAAAASLRR